MKTEELLKPRYKVIAEWPFMAFHLNAIHPVDLYTSEGCHDELFFKKYPHLFKELSWWEDRTIEELPIYCRYTKFSETGHVFKVLYYSPNDKPWIAYVKGGPPNYNIALRDCQPANEEEFLNYQKTKA